jgi:peptide/nickel transport system permease protein
MLSSVEGKIGAFLLVLLLVVLVLGPAIAPYSPDEIGVGVPNSPMSWHHVFGTDELGRDVASRILYGARSVVFIPLLATSIAFTLGGVIGMVGGYRGGRWDIVSGRMIDVFLALPPLLIVLVIIAAFGSSTGVIIIAVALVYAPRIARVLRGATQGVARRDFVLVAQARGERPLAVVFQELLPNIAGTVTVEFAVRLTYVIIFIATLSFLGLGVQPPSPNWGAMVSESRTTILTAPIVTIAPTVAIGLACAGIGLVADSLSKALGLESDTAFFR